jgi:hypothetical protein
VLTVRQAALQCHSADAVTSMVPSGTIVRRIPPDATRKVRMFADSISVIQPPRHTNITPGTA